MDEPAFWLHLRTFCQRLHANFSAKRCNRPHVPTEIGYTSVAGTNQQLYASLNGNGEGIGEQNRYEAFFHVLSAQACWIKGVFLWVWTVSATGKFTLSATQRGGYLRALIVSITGISGTQTATITIAVSVTATPGFTLSSAAFSISLPQTTSTVTVIPLSGFSGVVTLVVGDLPSGVRGTFATTPSLRAASSALRQARPQPLAPAHAYNEEALCR